MKANKDNFYMLTEANWKQVENRTTEPDHISESFSKYWFTPEGVYRMSDHWGECSTCNWVLDGEQAFLISDVTGFCKWEDFKLRERAKYSIYDEKGNYTGTYNCTFENMRNGYIHHEDIKIEIHAYRMMSN